MTECNRFAPSSIAAVQPCRRLMPIPSQSTSLGPGDWDILYVPISSRSQNQISEEYTVCHIQYTLQKFTKMLWGVIYLHPLSNLQPSHIWTLLLFDTGRWIKVFFLSSTELHASQRFPLPSVVSKETSAWSLALRQTLYLGLLAGILETGKIGDTLDTEPWQEDRFGRWSPSSTVGRTVAISQTAQKLFPMWEEIRNLLLPFLR